MPQRPLLTSVPGSKSLTQRGLLVAALADAPLTLHGALRCDDSEALSRLLRALGVTIDWHAHGANVRPAPLCARGATIDCGNAGTTLRFGACLSLLTEGELVLDGTARMRQRPVAELATALQELGVRVRFGAAHGYPPLALRRAARPGAVVSVDVSRSSQFASGLLLVAPRLPHGLQVELSGAPVSSPYVTMTTALMSRAGAAVSWSDERVVRVSPGGYHAAALGGRLDIEPDWSSAAFVLAAGWLLGRPVHVRDLPDAGASLQGDARFAALLRELSLPREHTLDLGSTPDLVPPLVGAALFASHRTRIHGVAHLRHKECDRLAVLARQLGRLGAVVRQRSDGLDVEPFVPGTRRPPTGPQTLDPADDHRMAMTFGLVGLRLQGVTSSEPGCVSKSFPGFWDTFDDLRRQAERTP